MNDRLSVRNLKNRIARHVRHTPIFRDHFCHTANNTFSCPICALHERIDRYPLAVLSVLRHFHFFNEAYLPEESDLFDILGPEKVNRMIEEEQRRLFGSVKVKCKKCSHEVGFFDTYRENLRRSSGTSFVFRCIKCKVENSVLLFKEKDRIKIKKSQRKIKHLVREIPIPEAPMATARIRRTNPFPVRPDRAVEPLRIAVEAEEVQMRQNPPNYIFQGNTTTTTRQETTGGDHIINDF